MRFSLLFLMFSLVACVTKPGTENIEQLRNLNTTTVISNSDGVSSIRLQALQDTAMTIGAQSGLANHAKQLNVTLEKKATYLDQVFNFHALLLPHGVLPPILAEGREEFNLAADDSIRVSDRVYKIISQAHFVSTPPNWRDYLYLSYTSPDFPDRTLLPQSRKERAIWQKYVTLGWNEGARQCDAIFEQNLARLKRDFSGMVLYRQLLAQNMVSPPFVAKASLGVTGGGSELRVNDQVLRITAMPSLQSNTKRWKPALQKEGPGMAPN